MPPILQAGELTDGERAAPPGCAAADPMLGFHRAFG